MTKVWFDDLTITHHQDVVTQATDCAPWGDVVREQKTNDLDIYRYGYQGKYAERDEETGWDHFEAREYDWIIGRWLVPDPSSQHSSPYLAFSNNPVNNTDPDGRWDFGQKVKNWFRFGEFLTNTQFDAKYSDRVTVFIWDKTSDKDVGHTALEVDGVVYGYYPTDLNGNGAYDKGDLNNSPGELHVDARVDFNKIYAGDKINSYSVKVTPAQKASVLANLKDVKLNPGTYSLIGRQCTSTVMNVMGKSGIKISDAGGSLDRNHIGVAPKAFEGTLKNNLNSFLIAGKSSFTVKP